MSKYKQKGKEYIIELLRVTNNFFLKGTEVTSTAAELNILDGVTATAAEINILDGVTATAAELNLLDNQVADAVIVVAAEGGANTINVTVQLNDAAGTAMANVNALHFYLADDAVGADVATTAPDGGIAIGTDGSMTEYTANIAGVLMSEADGDIDINVIESGVATWYLVVILPNGSLSISAAITF